MLMSPSFEDATLVHGGPMHIGQMRVKVRIELTTDRAELQNFAKVVQSLGHSLRKALQARQSQSGIAAIPQKSESSDTQLTTDTEEKKQP
jgi:hypothetical protein